MEKLECIIVHRSMSLVSSLASLSLATPTISTILVMFVTAKLFANEVDYQNLLNMQWYKNDRGSRLCLFYVLRTRPGGERKG